MARPSLEAALRRNLHDEHTWAVLGDLLAAEGDARGELIALEQRATACERPFEKAVLEHQAAELFEHEHRAWLGPLADAGLEITWMRGFATEVVIRHRHTSTLAKLLELPTAALLRKLVFVRPRGLSSLAELLAGCPIERLELRLPSESDMDPAVREAARRNIQSLQPLGSLVQLRELIVIGGNTEGLEDLSALPQLDTLALRRSAGSLAGLGVGFTSLRSLDLSARANVAALGPDPLAPLVNLRALERLSLNDGGWTDIGRISELPALVHLDLRSTNVSSLAPLANLASLETLELRGCPEVTNIDALAGLTKLTRIDLAYTKVRRLQPLANSSALELVELSGTPVRDLSPLFGLPALRKVELETCEIDNLEPLRARGVSLIGVRPPAPTWRDLAEGLLQRSRGK